MTRYFYYLVIMCMITNTIFFVPNILIEHRFEGSVSALVFSLVSGTICTYLFTRAIGRFPGEGLPEILRRYVPAWVSAPFLAFLVFMWMVAGGIVLVRYAVLVQRFINPTFNVHLLICVMVVICAWAASASSCSVIYTTEIVVLLSVPLTVFILFKAFTNENMDYDAVRVVINYWDRLPNWASVSAATYVFTGYINLAIFNRLTGIYGAIKLRWGIPLLGSLVLLTTFFIPIGIHGTIAVNDYIYIWPSTADSLRMEFGFIERVLFVFLLLYLNFSLVFICVTWHVGAELLKGIFTRRPGPVDPDVVHMSWLAWGLFLLFGVLMLLVIRNYNEKELLHVSSIWFEIRYAAELLLVAVMCWIGRKGAGAA